MAVSQGSCDRIGGYGVCSLKAARGSWVGARRTQVCVWALPQPRTVRRPTVRGWYATESRKLQEQDWPIARVDCTLNVFSKNGTLASKK